MSATIKDAIKRLRELADGAYPENTCAGLCCEMHEYQINVKRLAKGWSKHSGDKFYPIPASNHDRSPFEEYSRTMNLWGSSQGKLRRELCAYIADKLAERGAND